MRKLALILGAILAAGIADVTKDPGTGLAGLFAGWGRPALVIIVLGGLGSIPGCVIAAILFGIVQTLCIVYLPAGSTDIVIYSILFLVLLVRPSGIMGRESTVIGAGHRA